MLISFTNYILVGTIRFKYSVKNCATSNRDLMPMSNDDLPSFSQIRSRSNLNSAPRHWNGWDEWTDPREIYRQAWDELRHRSYVELERLRDRLQERVQEVKEAESNLGNGLQERIDFMVEHWREWSCPDKMDSVRLSRRDR